MADADLGTVERPGRRRESWSLRTIVENVAGRPITDFQDPDRPVHPYLANHLAHLPSPERPRPRSGRGSAEELPPDPVDRVYPPLTGATGRALHGPEHEHHTSTLRALDVPDPDGGPSVRVRPPGPSRRPERVYLHYLLLHLDRLGDHALRYLAHAVEEELSHRGRSDPPSTAPPAP